MVFIRTIAFVTLFAFIPLAGLGQSVDVLTKADQVVEEISVAAIRPGTSMEDFLQRYPAAKKLPVGANVFPKNDLYELTIDNGTDHPPSVVFEFESGVLKQIKIEFSRDSLKAVTENGQMLVQLESHFGTPELSSKGVQADLGTVDVYCWDFSHVERQITFYDFHDGTAQLLFFDAPAKARVPHSTPKTSLLGFD